MLWESGLAFLFRNYITYVSLLCRAGPKQELQKRVNTQLLQPVVWESVPKLSTVCCPADLKNSSSLLTLPVMMCYERVKDL